MNPDILAVSRGRRWVLRPLSMAGGLFLSEGGESRRDGSLVVTPHDYQFLVRRAAELGLDIAATASAIRWNGCTTCRRRESHDEPRQGPAVHLDV